MALERKFVSLVNFKQSSEGAGGLEGYASVFNEIDEGGDLILSGAFSETIPSFLQKGFTAHSHDWSVNGAVGYPMEAREDEHGLYVVSKFHSTPDAQLVRTKAAERLADGKQVGLSIGFSHAAAPKFIYPAQYRSELAKYCKADRLEANLAKAQRFAKIRILSKTNLYEYSIVTAPMNQLAQATSVKSIETKGEYLGDYIEASMTIGAVSRVLDAFWWRVIDWIYETDEPLEERLGKIQGAANEMSALIVKAIAAIMSGESEETPDEAVKAIKSLYLNPSDHETGSRAGLVFSKHSEVALAAVKGWTERIQGIAAWKGARESKEGRVLSDANRALIKDVLEQMGTCSTSLQELYDATEPQQKDISAGEAERLYAEFVYLGAQIDGAIGA